MPKILAVSRAYPCTILYLPAINLPSISMDFPAISVGM
jgi:hypothetical protein